MSSVQVNKFLVERCNIDLSCLESHLNRDLSALGTSGLPQVASRGEPFRLFVKVGGDELDPARWRRLEILM